MTTKPIRILIVEDEAIVAMDIQARLELQGYTVVGPVSNGVAAVALALDVRPDLVLMDIRLQGEMDGITAAQRIREQLHSPIVFLTAYAEEHTLQRAKLAEPFGYILKPFEDRELHTIIEIAIYKHRAEQEIRHLNRLYAVLSQINQMIVRVSDVGTLLTDACSLAVKFGQFPLVYLGEYAADKSSLKVHAMSAAHPDLELDFGASEIAALTEWLPPIGFWGPGKTFLVKNEDPPLSDRGWYEFANRHRLRASIAAAIRPYGTVWGILSFHSNEPDFFGEKELSLVEEIALDVGYAIENLEREAEHRRIQGVVSRQEQMLRSVTENMRDQLCLADIEGRFRYATPSYGSVLGLRPADLLGESVFDRVHPEDKPKAQELFRACIEERQPQSYEFRYRHAAGHYIWMEARGGVVLGADGTVAGLVITSRDLTERKQAEATLRESEERYRSLVETTYDWVWEMDAQCRYTYASARVSDLLGYSPQEVVGQTPFDFMPEEEARRMRAVFDGIVAKRRSMTALENTYLHKSGGLVVLETNGTPVLGPDGEFSGYRGMDRDITGRKHLEEQLRQSQKMEAVGLLAGGISHDFNNLLGVMIGNADLILGKIGPGPQQRYAEAIKIAGGRAAQLVRQLLAFSRKQVLHPTVLDVNAVVIDISKILERLIGEDVRIATNLEPELGAIRADRGQLEQILMNLATNARDAMPTGGTFTIRSENAELGPDDVARYAYVTPGNYVHLRVSDTGVGMSEAVRNRVFEPFFTTKEQGRGTGLGLATVYGITKQSGGYVWVSSSPGAGATFDVYLPRVDDKALPLAPNLVVRGEYPGGTETILVVEDEDSLRQVTCEFLASGGYNVLQAGSGDVAIDLASQYKGSIPLMICDVVLPEMSGPLTVEKLQALHPETQVLYVSGYAEVPVAQQLIADGATLLQKPISRMDLLKKVDAILHSRIAPHKSTPVRG